MKHKMGLHLLSSFDTQMGENTRRVYAAWPTKADNDLPMALALVVFGLQYSGGRLNKKNGLTRYGNSHVKDKTS